MDRKIYYKYFEEKVKPRIQELEKQRKKNVFKVVLTSIFMFCLGVVCAFIFVTLAFKDNFILLFMPIILFLMYIFFIKSITNIIIKGKEYQKSLIINILPYFLEPIANFKNWPKNRDITSFLDAKIFPEFENREDDFSIFGIYKDVNVIISSTKLTIPVNKIMFQGITIQLELNKSIDNHVVFMSKNNRKINPYRQINPQIEDLNKYLYTFSKNENTNFITEDFWNCIKKIGEAYIAKSFVMSYKDKTILIALSQKNPFKFGFIFKSLLKPENYDDLIDMFTTVFSLVDVVTLV